MAVVLGTLLGIGRLAPHVLVRGLCGLYVQIVRNVPLLVQVLLWYFALTELLPDADAALHFGDWVFLSKGGLAFAEPEIGPAMAAIAAFNVSG